MEYEWAEDLLELENGATRLFRERRNPFMLYNNSEFCDRFHISRQTAEDILHCIAPRLQHDTLRNYCLSPEIQFLIALRFLTSATLQGVCT